MKKLTLTALILVAVFALTGCSEDNNPTSLTSADKVKPSERTEMSAIYSSFRDVSSVVTPGMAWAVLAVAPTAAIFTASGALMGMAYLIAGKLHPRLGTPRPSRGGS